MNSGGKGRGTRGKEECANKTIKNRREEARKQTRGGGEREERGKETDGYKKDSFVRSVHSLTMTARRRATRKKQIVTIAKPPR